GGREKGNDYSVIKELIREKVKKIILIGEAKDKIRNAFLGIVPMEEAEDLESAVKKAFLSAEEKGTVLLSPMCKSFDMFSNFEERGKVFKEMVYRLVRQNVSSKA
ncbi:MAG: UDP-N-acetylmuramoyl-L-alanine--D-glutamate ligase, partial [Candidatus Omnitrophica bacterium]|nr:UDP-N-acetylmuramoyl-L-alanine--D-glutamate ligase [Candidatus Omnitrophota bacterium]